MRNGDSAIRISIGIPVYNEEAVIAEFYGRLKRILDDLPKQTVV